MQNSSRTAPGAPGIDPRWTSSAKDGVGTAYHTSSRLWFTLSHGIINEIYYPFADIPNTRDLQFLITDGETFCHEEKRDLHHATEYPEQSSLLYRLTNSEPQGRYRIIKEIIGEPHNSVLLIQTRLEILDPALKGKLRLFALLAPHLKGTGKNNSADWLDTGGQKFLHAWREDIHLVMGCSPGFTRRSAGYVGHSDGWQDLKGNFKMDWEYEAAMDGNVALTAEIDLSQGLAFTLGVAFGRSAQSGTAQLMQAFATSFKEQREKYVSQWQRTRSEGDLCARLKTDAHLVRLSQCVLLAHEDKAFPGAFVASLSIPWGETKDDSDQGGYHLVWARDLVQSATALPDKPRHYIRITPATPDAADGSADPNQAMIKVANGGGEHPARNVVGGDFLQLVRLGIRASNDPLIVASLAVVDTVLKRDLPQGPCWRRYNHDGYGQKDDGSAFDGTGVGRSWPILTGERGHYELAAGRDPAPYITAMEKFTNSGGMLPEQLWDAPDLPNGRMKLGEPSGSAMPLCWAHAEYLSLVRSKLDGRCFDRIEPAYQRYAGKTVPCHHEIWIVHHPISQMPPGTTLRLILAANARVHWTADNWATTQESDTKHVASLNVWFADLPSQAKSGGPGIEFTFFWKEAQTWEGKNYRVEIKGPKKK